MVTEKNKIIAKAEEKRKYLTGEAERERLQELREKAEFDEATAYAAGKAKGEKYGEKRGEKRGEARGERRGIKIGRKTTLIETAKNMLKNNIDISLIQKCTGLSLSEVTKIKM